MEIFDFKVRFQENYPEIEIEEFSNIKEGDDYYTFEINREIIVKFPKTKEIKGIVPLEINLLSNLIGKLQIDIPKLNFSNKTNSINPFLGYSKIHGIAFDIDGDEKSLSKNINILGRFFRDLSLINPSDAPHRELVSNWKKFYSYLLKGIREKAYEHIPRHYSQEVEKIIVNNHKNFIANDFKPVLIHADLKPDHLICKGSDNIISGIIDWGDAGFGDVSFEYARVLTEFGFNFYKRLIQENSVYLAKADYQKIAFYSILIPFFSILNGVNSSDKNILERGRQRLNTSLNSYETVGRLIS